MNTFAHDDTLLEFAPLGEWLLGPVRMALLTTAIDLGIPDLLAKTGDAAEVARHLGAHTANTRLLLDALTAMGLTRKHGDRYSNSSLAERHLRAGSETSLLDVVQRMTAMQHRNLGRLGELVRNGPPPLRKTEKLQNPDLWRKAARGLANYQRSGLARFAADLAASLPESQSLKRMLDLGGGPGIVGMAIVERHPGMTGVLCDMPDVTDTAQEEIAARGLAQRVGVLSGDYNTVDFGGGFDLVWASHTLYYANDLDAFMGKVLDCLNPGGVFMSLHEGLERKRTSPEFCVLSRLSLALEGQDVSFDSGRIAGAMIGAGFQTVESRPVQLSLGSARLDIARKAGRLPGAGADS